jgi:hypothetical protein
MSVLPINNNWQHSAVAIGFRWGGLATPSETPQTIPGRALLWCVADVSDYLFQVIEERKKGQTAARTHIYARDSLNPIGNGYRKQGEIHA